MYLRRLALFFFSIYSTSLSVYGQDYFQKAYVYPEPPNFSFDLTLLPDGKIAMLSGSVRTQDSGERGNLVLLDARGELIWSRQLVSGISWGNRVFETRDIQSPGWDGKVDGLAAPADVYGWSLEYETSVLGRPEKKQDKGNLTLLR